jgi:hypothetical protein
MLDSGTTRSLYLFRQLPGGAVAFHAQGVRHHKRIFPGRFLKHTLIPQSACAVLLKGLPVKTREVWLGPFRAHNAQLLYPRLVKKLNPPLAPK